MDLSYVVNRAKHVMSSPASFWDWAKTDTSSGKDLLLTYALPLTVLASAASFVKFTIFGIGIPMVGTVRTSFSAGIGTALFRIVSTFVSIAVVVFLLQKLAPVFKGSVPLIDAVKLSVYSMTAGWLGGIAILVPYVGTLVALVLSVYSLVILFKGIKVLTNVPPENTGKYFGSCCVVAIVLNLAIHFATGGPQRGPVTLSTKNGEISTEDIEKSAREWQQKAGQMMKNSQQGDTAK